MKFLVYAGDELMGWSALEAADPPMGCVWGVFHANENYDKIEHIIRHYSQVCETSLDGEEYNQAWEHVKALGLTVTPEQGESFDAVGGISLVDYAKELGAETGREVSVLGLHHETFLAYFKAAHDEYWQS